jgi:hypothetical protein
MGEEERGSLPRMTPKGIGVPGGVVVGDGVEEDERRGPPRRTGVPGGVVVGRVLIGLGIAVGAALLLLWGPAVLEANEEMPEAGGYLILMGLVLLVVAVGTPVFIGIVVMAVSAKSPQSRPGR